MSAPKSLQRFLAPSALSPVGAREIHVVVATQNIARDGNIIVTGGIDLSGFEKYRTVLFNHDPGQPIGRCTQIGLVGTDLTATVEFAPQGASSIADEVCALVKAGTLNACSIGWMPIQVEPLRDRSGRQTGWKFVKSEILEFSIVSTPADVGALIVARSGDSRQGKVLSSANEDHLRAIADSASEISRRAEAVLRQMPATDADTGGIGDWGAGGESEDVGRSARARRARELKAAALRQNSGARSWR